MNINIKNKMQARIIKIIAIILTILVITNIIFDVTFYQQTVITIIDINFNQVNHNVIKIKQSYLIYFPLINY